MSRELGVPFLGAIPLDADIVMGGDKGRPIVLEKPNSVAAMAYLAIATELAGRLQGLPTTGLKPFAWTWETGGNLFIVMSGGCQGCAASSVTLRHGFEVMVRRVAPEIVDIVDTTDHAAGEKPFYQRTVRSFRFRNFREPLTFVQEIGELAEAEGHHPNISFGWGNATVSLQTKKIKGLHENDFIMATKIDRIFARTATA
jgi:pterin-4a-carbinolamine dehydratase